MKTSPPGFARRASAGKRGARESHACSPPAPPPRDIHRRALPPKARGELAEARFIAKALGLGLTLAKPFGDSAKYDFIVDAGGRLSRVQVKSAWVRAQKGYQVMAGPGCNPRSPVRRKYRRDEIDFLVAYIAPQEAWFVFPIAGLTRTYVRWNSRSVRRLARYQDRWDLLFAADDRGAKRPAPAPNHAGIARCR